MYLQKASTSSTRLISAVFVAVFLLVCAKAFPLSKESQSSTGGGGQLEGDPNSGVYLLITRDALEAEFTELVEYRMSKGFQAELFTIEWIKSKCTKSYPDDSGDPDSVMLREFISEYFKDIDSGRKYVCLGGDHDIIPVRICRMIHNGELYNVPSDMYYADFDGALDNDGDGIYGEADAGEGDLIPEVLIGRITVSEPNEAAGYIDKVIKYESIADSNDFVSRILLTGGFGGLKTGTDRPEEFRDHEPVDDAEPYLDELFRDSIQPFWQGKIDTYYSTRTSWDEMVCGDFVSEPVEADNSIEVYNRGYNFIVNVSHGYFSDFFGMSSSWASSLKNVDMPSIIYSIACNAGAFDDLPAAPLGEEFIRNSRGGAVAFVGYSRVSSDTQVDLGYFCRQVFDIKTETIGEAFSYGKMDWVELAREFDGYTLMYLGLNLLGDPALRIKRDYKGKELDIWKPDGCEIIDVFTPIYIRWNAVGNLFDPDDKIKIEYSDDSGNTWHRIPGAESLNYDEALFVWRDHGLARGDGYRIRLSLVGDPDVFSQSRKDFMVEGSQKYLYVNDEEADVRIAAGDNDSNGLTPQTPMRSIQGILDKYPAIGWDEIIVVAPGEYRENIVIDSNHSGLEIRGTDSAGCFIDGDDSGSCITTKGASSIRIKNLTIENGSAIGGGGMYLEQGSAVIEGCTIRANHAVNGGAIYSFSSDVTASGCEFLQNDCDSFGGAICSTYAAFLSINASNFCSNSSTYGGAVYLTGGSTTEIRGSVLQSNSATDTAAIHIAGSANVSIANCIVTGNLAHRYGGAIGNYSSGTVAIEKCTICGNRASYSTAGLFFGQGSTTSLRNCIIASNELLLDVNDEVVVQANASLDVAFCNLGDESPAPCFIAPGLWDSNGTSDTNDDVWVSGDYHLKSAAGRWNPAYDDSTAGRWEYDDVTSPCIDAGDPNSVWTAELWPHGRRINMGAYGGTAEASMSLDTAGNRVDLNKDGRVDLIDYSLLSNSWCSGEELLDEDIDRNNFVSLPDLALFVEEWLSGND